MIGISGYFIIFQYFESVKSTEQSELLKMQGIVQTFALQIDTDFLKPEFAQGYKLTPTEEYQDIRNGLSGYLHNVNRINDLNQGIGLILISNRDGQAEIITHKGTVYYDQANSVLQKIIDEKPSNGFVASRGEFEDNQILYAYPVALPFSHTYSGYIFAIENIDKKIITARNQFLKHVAIALLTLLILALMVRRSLLRILSHEVLSKKKLQEYAMLADTKNKELEVLSFVLSKSENLILLTDEKGKIEWLNESYTRKNNYSENELSSFVGRELAEVSHYPMIREVISKVVLTKKKLIYEAKSYDANGSEFWASTTVTPILNGLNEVERLLFMDADITRMKLAEAEISKLANFAAENENPLIRIQYDGKLLYANEPAKPILKHWNTKVGEYATKQQLQVTIETVRNSGKECKLNMECEKRIFSLRFAPVKEKDYVNVYGEDITEIKIAERESLARVSKLEEYNLNITDSINYARRIQQAIIPGEDHLRRYFKDSFVLSKPKDIVSGDFFWIYELVPAKSYLLALADCTGHGVPGAMMSIIGHGLLNEIVEVQKAHDPSRILEKLNVEVIKSLRQKSQNQSWDGMDVSIIKIDLEYRNITFAGAYQPLYWMNGKLNIMRGDRQPIGGLHHNVARKFNNIPFQVNKGDSVYLVSDGFTDQFGGPDNKKFLSRRLNELIESNHRYSMQAQSHLYNTAFEDWRGNYEQIDDVSMIGIKFL
jgi:PAS domain S-box-containing protein